MPSKHQPAKTKLTDNDVLTIVAALGRGESHASLSRRFGVSASTISGIRDGRQWQWLTGRVPPENMDTKKLRRVAKKSPPEAAEMLNAAATALDVTRFWRDHYKQDATEYRLFWQEARRQAHQALYGTGEKDQ